MGSHPRSAPAQRGDKAITLTLTQAGRAATPLYLDDFLGDLPGLVDVQRDLGVPHKRV